MCAHDSDGACRRLESSKIDAQEEKEASTGGKEKGGGVEWGYKMRYMGMKRERRGMGEDGDEGEREACTCSEGFN